ncbi:MAG TPA: hypothetical protein VF017_02085 [Thermoanaerobaculia bacterium]|nr:hypothetical protein [Thermoanaerobaculia bacterium]
MKRGSDPAQLGLFAEETPATLDPGKSANEDGLARRLGPLLRGRTVALTLTDNRQRIVSVRPLEDGSADLALRLDRSFVQAPEDVLCALARWVLGRGRERRSCLEVIRRYFKESSREKPRGVEAARRPRALDPVGRNFDLATLRDTLNQRYFEGRLTVDITWGRTTSAKAGRRRQRTSIRLGSYCYATKVVRIHRAMDHPSVPRYVVEAVIYHELLHAALPPPAEGRGRRRLHPPEFRDAERRFELFSRAERWLQQNLQELLGRH